MMQCLFSGDTAQLSELLETSPSEASKTDQDKRSLMHAAAYLGDEQTLEK